MIAYPLVAGALLVVNGVVVLVWNVLTVSLRQAIIPDRLLGRVGGAQPAGALGAGLLAHAVGLRWREAFGAKRRHAPVGPARDMTAVVERASVVCCNARSAGQRVGTASCSQRGPGRVLQPAAQSSHWPAKWPAVTSPACSRSLARSSREVSTSWGTRARAA